MRYLLVSDNRVELNPNIVSVIIRSMQKSIRGLFLVLFVLLFQIAEATHIRAIEITGRRISATSLTFEFTITGYRDTEGVQFSAGTFDFGDGSSTNNLVWTFVEDVGNDTEKWQFTLTHTYAGPGAYKVSYFESFRNVGITNMTNSGSTDYYTESLIVIDPLIGLNSTPILTVPPIDFAASGLTFIHNPGAFDVDGDSISYRFSIPLQSDAIPVNGYRSPINPAFYENFSTGNETQDGPPTLTLDSISGDLLWNAPGEEGEYNVAFIVEEWRKIDGQYFRLGFVTRDMQIIVVETDNEKPELTPPDDLCVAAGTFIDETIYDPDIEGTDPDNDPVTISAFGGPFELTPSASYSPFPAIPQGPPGFMQFEWQTDCSLIRERAYEVQLKIEDNPAENPGRTQPAPKLVDFETWQITVVGPAPTGLITSPLPNRRMQLDWDQYSCPNEGATMQIWRKVGEFDFLPDSCDIGIPENAGYELIDSVPIDEMTYTDTNNGIGLAPGANYCYRLVATFPEPAGGTSYASMESCQEVISIVPLITKVDVLSTSETDGDMRIEWIEPLDLDVGLHPGPYTYDVLRSTGLSGLGPFQSVATGLTDLFYEDAGLNTEDDGYSYKILMYDNTAEPLDSSFAASSVRLELVPQVGAINVTWSSNTPWSIQVAGLTHDVYRDRVNPSDPAELVLIGTAEVTETGLSFLDDGSHNGVMLDESLLYCYRVRTQGSYDNDDPMVPEPLINFSQIQCAQPNDETPPCTPINLTFDDAFSCEAILDTRNGCDPIDYEHRFTWEDDMASECDDDIVSYNVYFSESGGDGTYDLLENTTNYTFTQLGLSSYKGCYRLSAVDRSGNESELSAPLCAENCIFDENGELGYKLPNAFTPNGDLINDTFRAFGNEDPDSCPRFVLRVEFLVVDRTGRELYSFVSDDEGENDIFINWDGTRNNGAELPTGTYFYSAIVTFDTLDPSLAVQTINGWVQIFR